MRLSPTSAVAWVLTSFIGFAWLGCATSNGDADTGGEAPASPQTSKKKGEEEPPRPEFDASFEGDPDAGDAAAPPDDECIDKDDPGGAENVAKELPATDDCDDNMKPIEGVANGPVDLDYYKLSGQDKFGCSVETEFETSTQGVELCVYARCKNSTADAVTGCAAGTLKTSEIGMKGCCAAGPSKATPEWDCSGFSDNDSADFFVSVKPSGANKCLPYKFSYRF